MIAVVEVLLRSLFALVEGLACVMAPIVGRGCSSCGRLTVEVSEVCRTSLIDMVLVDNVPALLNRASFETGVCPLVALD